MRADRPGHREMGISIGVGEAATSDIVRAMPSPTPSLFPTPNVVLTQDTAAPLWTEVAGIWIAGAGAVASTAVAVAALVISIILMRAQRGDVQREARADWASEMQVWLDDSKVLMLVEGLEAFDEDWVTRGNLLMARAGVLSSPGAESLMLAAKAARVATSKLTPEERRRAVHPTTALLKLCVRDWVDDPRELSPPIADWVREFATISEGAE